MIPAGSPISLGRSSLSWKPWYEPGRSKFAEFARWVAEDIDVISREQLASTETPRLAASPIERLANLIEKEAVAIDDAISNVCRNARDFTFNQFYLELSPSVSFEAGIASISISPQLGFLWTPRL